MVNREQTKMTLLLLSAIVLSGLAAEALSYDYSVTLQCLESPQKPQYGGGIVVNPEFDHGLNAWTAFGDAKVDQRVSSGGGGLEGNKFIAVSNWQKPYHSFSQTFHLDNQKLYTFSAWLQVNQGKAKIAAIFKTHTSFQHAGWVVAESGCWSMLKGGLTVNASGLAQLYFESNNPSVEIWADSISLQPFSRKQWKSHQHKSINKARKSFVKFIAVDAKGNPLPNATVSLAQHKPSFPFGCAISNHILTNPAYQKWFTSRFSVTTFENEMKWASTERSRNKEDYSVPDAMMEFARENNVLVRGHNVFWNDPGSQPQWLNSLPLDQVRSAVDNRVNSVVKRYNGQVIAWDVLNENMHFSYFDSKLGQNVSAVLFNKVNHVDKATTLFLNEFNTVEEVHDGVATPGKYLEKIKKIRSGGYSGPLGIGLEAHFDVPNLPYMRASIDKLASAGLPIWITELDVSNGPNQAMYLEQVLREAHAHPHVNGIVMWASWRPEGCWRMCLTDNNFKNLGTGDVVDKLIREWTHGGFSGTTDVRGQFGTRLFHGDYEVYVTQSSITNGSPVEQSLNVVVADQKSLKKVFHVEVSA